MKWYEAYVSDMKVSVFCNGLDNLLSKTGYEFSENDDWRDSDVIVVFSAKWDKAVAKITDILKEEGSTASINAAIFTEEAKDSSLFDLTIKTDEKNLAFALSDFLKLIDYYLYITPVDVGYELSRRGAFTYVPTQEALNLLSVRETATSIIADSEDAIMLLEAGDEIFISDVENLTYELSEFTEDKRLTVAPLRTLTGERVRFGLLVKR